MKRNAVTLVEVLVVVGALLGVAALNSTPTRQLYRVTYRAYVTTASDPDAAEITALLEAADMEALVQFLRERAADVQGMMQAAWGGLWTAVPLPEDAEESDEGILVQMQAAKPDGTFELVGKAVGSVEDGQVVTLSPWADKPEGYTLSISVKVSAGEDGKVLVGTHYEGNSPWFSGACNDIEYLEARRPAAAYLGVSSPGGSGSSSLPPTRRGFIQLVTVTPVEG